MDILRKRAQKDGFEHQSLAIERVTHDGVLDGVKQGDAVLVRLSPRQHTSDMVFPFNSVRRPRY